MQVEEFVKYCERIVSLVEVEQDMSLSADTNSLFQKQLAIGVASAFEVELCGKIRLFVDSSSVGNKELLSFFENKAIARQYHTWFNWNESNANSFYGLFGPEFKRYMINRVQHDEILRQSVKAFLELGKDRNEIIHGDFLNHPYNKTVDEVRNLYEKAKHFVGLFPSVLLDFKDEKEPPE